MRWLALGFLVLLATPARATCGEEDELKCETLIRKGSECVEYAWVKPGPGGNERARRGPLERCTDDIGAEWSERVTVIPLGCACNRYAYEYFSVAELMKSRHCH
jgi:hypothetical protein